MMVLMCKNKEVYDIRTGEVLNKSLLPGVMNRTNIGYEEWMKTRYSVGSNTTARRLLQRAFGAVGHKVAVKETRGLSLSDCYWVKSEDESIEFEEITPYLHEEWSGTGKFEGGSISSLFVNGAANKYWKDAETLVKVSSYKELEVYELCMEIGIENIPKVTAKGKDLLVKNFTSMDYFLESEFQSGIVGEDDNHISKWIETYGKKEIDVFVIDYIVEHDDRHQGNLGTLRDANTGEIVRTSPFFDFDWCWSGGVMQIPDDVINKCRNEIVSICTRAKNVSKKFKSNGIIEKRSDELLKIVDNLSKNYM